MTDPPPCFTVGVLQPSLIGSTETDLNNAFNYPLRVYIVASGSYKNIFRLYRLMQTEYNESAKET